MNNEEKELYISALKEDLRKELELSFLNNTCSYTDDTKEILTKRITEYMDKIKDKIPEKKYRVTFPKLTTEQIERREIIAGIEEYWEINI